MYVFLRIFFLQEWGGVPYIYILITPAKKLRVRNRDSAAKTTKLAILVLVGVSIPFFELTSLCF